MDKNLKWFYQLRAQHITRILLAKEYEAILVKDFEELKNILSLKIPKEKSIVNDNTPFINSLNLKDIFSNKNCKIYDSQKDKDALFAENFIAECDFVTESGEIIFLDDFASSVSIFGSNKVFIIIGVNKLVKNIDEAYEKAVEVLKLRRYFNDTNGNFGIIHNGRKFPDKYTILVVPEDIGF